MSSPERALLAGLMAAFLTGCSLLPQSDPPGTLRPTERLYRIAWLPSGIYGAVDTRGTKYTELKRYDPAGGDPQVVPWPTPPAQCDYMEYPHIGELGAQLYVRQECRKEDPPSLQQYLVYDPDSKSWSPLSEARWDNPPGEEIVWDARRKEGLLATSYTSCEPVYRLTAEGPTPINQVIPTARGKISTTERVRTIGGSCLHDGRIFDLAGNGRGQVVLLVSRSRAPGDTAQVGDPAELILADWTPGSDAPLSGFRTLAKDLDSPTSPTWSPDGSKVYWADAEAIREVEVATGEVRDIAPAGDVGHVAVSPDGAQVALLRFPSTQKDEEARSELRILDLQKP